MYCERAVGSQRSLMGNRERPVDDEKYIEELASTRHQLQKKWRKTVPEEN